MSSSPSSTIRSSNWQPISLSLRGPVHDLIGRDLIFGLIIEVYPSLQVMHMRQFSHSVFLPIRSALSSRSCPPHFRTVSTPRLGSLTSQMTGRDLVEGR